MIALGTRVFVFVSKESLCEIIIGWDGGGGGGGGEGTLIRGRHSLKLSKRHQNTFNLSLSSINKDSNSNKRIKCLTFKIVSNTPLFTKER